MKCIYCGTEPNNATTKKGLYVCCCYMLHKTNDEYTQYHKDRAPDHPREKGGALEMKTKELNDLLYVIRTNMTSITRYVRHERKKHPTLTEGQFLDRHLEYKELAKDAVNNILNYVNGKKGGE